MKEMPTELQASRKYSEATHHSEELELELMMSDVLLYSPPPVGLEPQPSPQDDFALLDSFELEPLSIR